MVGSDTAILKRRFPGFAWLPRWCREYLGLPNVIAAMLAIFSAGVWWDNHEKARDLSDMRKSLAALDSTSLKKSDITTLAFEIDEVWKWKKSIETEAELKLKPIVVTVPPVTPSKRH